jgi:hypothetical protein
MEKFSGYLSAKLTEVMVKSKFVGPVNTIIGNFLIDISSDMGNDN